MWNLIKPMLPVIIAQFAKNESQRQQIQASIAKAENLINKHKANPIDALSEAGVPKEFLQNMLGLANNPIVTGIASKFGYTGNDVQTAINDILNNYGSNTKNVYNASGAQTDNLAMLRKGLKQLH